MNSKNHSGTDGTSTGESIDDPAALTSRTIAAYAALGWKINLYVRLRLLSAPLVETAGYVPLRGRILDLGCGYGIFARILHLGSGDREVIGVDLMPGRIAAAQKTLPADGRLRFEVGDAGKFPAGPFDVIACIDLLHHMPIPAQDELLMMIAAALPRHGLLVIKDLEKRPLWKYLFHYAQDWARYRLRSRNFRSREEMTGRLDGFGFSTQIRSLAAGRPYPHVLYLARWKDAA